MKNIQLLQIALLLPISVRADEDFYSMLNLPKAGGAEAMVLVLLCCALVASVVIFEVVKLRRERSVASAADAARFEQNAKRFGLDEEEQDLMRSLALRTQAGVNELFETLALFEKGVDGIVTEALSTATNEAALDEREKRLQSLRKKLHFTIVEPGAPIASTRNLSSGQQLWILGPKKTVLGLAMVTLVRELSFSVRLSSKDFERMPLLESPLRMAFTRKADGIYGIEVPIVSVDRLENVVTCRHTLEFRRNQLRQDVRVETDFAVSIRCVATEAGDGKVQDPTAFMVKMIDLSGGGFSFITDRALAANDTVSVTAASPKLAIAGMQARIVGMTPIPGAGRTRYHAQFVNIDFETKENIIKYVFVRMREVNQR